MTAKKILLSIALAATALSFAASAQETTVKPLFDYPQVPDKLTKANMRANFMVEHLWDKCDLEKTTITDVEAFHETFTDYLSFFALADKTSVDKSIKKYVERVAKNQNNLNMTVGMLQQEVLNIHSQYCSDEVYGMFVAYLSENKKVPEKLKEVLNANVAILNNSKEGAQIADLRLAKSPSGATSLYSLSPAYTVLFLNTDGCTDCSIYKVRLSADLNTNRLIEAGKISVVSVYSDSLPDLDTRLAAEPQNWSVATAPNIEGTFDMRIRPSVYVLDAEKKIVSKFVSVDNMLSLMAAIANSNQ